MPTELLHDTHRVAYLPLFVLYIRVAISRDLASTVLYFIGVMKKY